MQLPAYSPVDPADLMRAVTDVLRRESYDPCQRLKEYLSKRFDAPEVVLTGSGTQALQLALIRATRSGRLGGARGLAALPAYSCYDVVTAAVGAGVRVVFYDINPVTLAPEPESLRAALRQGAEVVVAGNLYGFPLDWDRLQAECRTVGAVLIEDAAQGLGSGWRGRSFGAFGDYSVLSFGRGKGWTAGSGGALLARERVRDDVAATPAPAKKGAGAPAWVALWVLWMIGRPSLYRFPTLVPGLGLGETRYSEPSEVEGMPPVVAALACRLARGADLAIDSRREWASRWRTLRVDDRSQNPVWTPCDPLGEGTCGYLRYPICLPSEHARERLLYSGRQHGVAPGYPLPLPALSQSQGITVQRDAEAAGAHFLARSVVTLPTHPRMSLQDFRSVAEQLA